MATAHRGAVQPLSVRSSAPQRVVAVVSSDGAFRRALSDAFAESGREVMSGADHRCLTAVEGWSDWRRLEIEAVVIDLDRDVELSLDTLDRVRRRDSRALVVVLSRVFGALGSARVGANLFLEGDVQPATIVDAVARWPAIGPRA